MSTVQDSTAAMKADISFLAGELPHRVSGSENERAAAEYVQARMRDAIGNGELDNFEAPDTYAWTYAAFFGEYLLVFLVSLLWPMVAFVYGSVELVLFVTENAGFPIISRLLPKTPSQNVIGRLGTPHPDKTIVVSAHYDSARSSPLFARPMVHVLRPAFFLAFISMIVVTVTPAAAHAFNAGPTVFPWLLALRVAAVAYLLILAAVIVLGQLRGVPVPGAIDNASGTAVMLELTRRFAADPPENTALLFVATGGEEAGMNGMVHLLRTNRFERDGTFFLNIDHVGCGNLRYVTKEGMLKGYRASATMREVAARSAPNHQAAPTQFRLLTTDALIPLARDYEALSLMCFDAGGFPPHWHQPSDTADNLDFGAFDLHIEEQ